MSKWKRKQQEKDGDYFFDGKLFVTRGVFEKIPTMEVVWIIKDVQAFANENNGADYLQVYESESTGQTLWVMDQISRSARLAGHHPTEHHYFTILFPNEY